MTDKKPTDSEIVKALEWHLNNENNCDECPLLKLKNTTTYCVDVLMQNALDLINRLQADVENYKQIAENQQKIILDKAFENKRLRTSNDALRMANELCKGWEERAKAEAYKKFAERLKSFLLLNRPGEMSVLSFDDIERLLKEMVGEDNG